MVLTAWFATRAQRRVRRVFPVNVLLPLAVSLPLPGTVSCGATQVGQDGVPNLARRGVAAQIRGHDAR